MPGETEIPDSQQIEEMLSDTQKNFAVYTAKKVSKLRAVGRFKDADDFLDSSQRFLKELVGAYRMAIEFCNTPSQFWAEIKHLLHEYDQRTREISSKPIKAVKLKSKAAPLTELQKAVLPTLRTQKEEEQ